MVITKEKLNFSSREMEVLNLIKDGFSSREIARKLLMTDDAIETYRRTMIKKTGAKNMIMVVYAAKDCGLI